MNNRVASTLVKVVFVSLTLALGAVAFSQEAAEEPKRGGVLRLGTELTPDVFDPQLSTSGIVQILSKQIYATLLENDYDMNIVPGLAESWVQEDDVTLILSLRPNLTFHNGEPLTAEDVQFTFDRLRDPATGATYAGSYQVIDQIEVVDDLTVRITLRQPSAPFVAQLTHYSASILPKDYVEDGGDLRTNPVGSGPFVFQELAGMEVSLTAFPDYYIEGLPYLDGLVVNIIPDRSAIVSALRTAEVDIIYRAPNEILALLSQDPNIVLRGGPIGGFRMFLMNIEVEPFDDVKVRQAVAYAIDRQEVLDAGLGGHGQVAYGPIPVGHWAALESACFQQDLVRSRQLLAEAGYPNGFDTTITVVSRALETREAQVIQQHLAEVGISAEIETLELGEYTDRWTGKRLVTTHVGNSGMSEPDQYMDRYRTGSGVNRGNFSDPTIDELAALGARQLDQAERQATYRELQQRLCELSPVVWTVIPHYSEAMQSYVKGYVHTFTEVFESLKEVWLDR